MTFEKPRGLEPAYAAQFADAAVVEAYRFRPPYPDEVFDILERLMAGHARVVLELGSGPGEIARRLAPRVAHVDAVEPSAAMLALARSLPGGRHPHIAWHQAAAEDFAYRAQYGLVVAAQSLHWMDWDRVVPAIGRCLLPGACLAIITRSLETVPWWQDIQPLIPQYSTNRDFRPYDLLDELAVRGLFRVDGRATTRPTSVAQSVDDYVESWHSRNGFSRALMGAATAAAFDQALRRVVATYASSGTLQVDARVEVVWGRPCVPCVSGGVG